MSRIRKFPVPAVLVLLVATASLAYGQGSTSATTSAPMHDKSSTTASTSTKQHTSAPKVDLNHATKEQLAALPGMSEATADKIIAARPFKSKSELTSKNILTKKEYDAVAKHIMIKEEKAAHSTGK